MGGKAYKFTGELKVVFIFSKINREKHSFSANYSKKLPLFNLLTGAEGEKSCSRISSDGIKGAAIGIDLKDEEYAFEVKTKD
ncbi:hypothetical protein SAMN06296241_3005 [Salinimicrobium sediminis]|uniref:Uncharacterized protein n=1 Tax=Salinimicrobium sediminis TaxID=1343891 RepID=A0A285XAG6_9FLAO|nr:hypothetical protein SAMN06296241_3005 [Salinimicrobium sediminis]